MQLDTLALVIQSNPGCQVFATGYGADLCAKCGERSWDRTHKVLSYLLKHGIQQDRLRIASQEFISLDIVSLKLAYVEKVTPPLRVRNH